MRSGGICCGPAKDITEHRCRCCQQMVPVESTRWIIQWPICLNCASLWQKFKDDHPDLDGIHLLFEFLREGLPDQI